jgi:hypothetical protein
MHPFFLLAGWHVTVPSGYMVCKHFFLAAFVRKVAPVFSLIFFPAGLWQKKLSRLSRFAVSYFLFFSPSGHRPAVGQKKVLARGSWPP